jgi:hypothetical protein
MKKILLIVTIILSNSIIAQNLKALDDKNGFREYKFGDTITKFTNLKVIESNKDSTNVFYKRTDDKLTIGEYEVELIYGFYKGQFSTLFIKTKGYTNSRGVLKTLIELYGKGFQDNKYIEKYSWTGNLVRLSYDENSATNNASTLMYSLGISAKKKNDEQEKVNKAKGDM